MANPLLTTALNFGNYTGETWSKSIRSGVLSRLAPNLPNLMVGSTDYFTFTGTPKAELVGEGANKSSEDGTPTKVTAKTYKVQLTYRFSDEVKWADEDHQTHLVENLANRISVALSRALDLIAIHGINPKTGEIASSVSEYFDKPGNGINRVVSTANPQTDIETAAGYLQSNGYMATGIAFDPAYSGTLARKRDNDGRPLYPELGLGFNVENFQGLQAASSDTVSGRQELEASEVSINALMGDFNAFEWGIAREVPLDMIETGDPDGLGDLKRTNQIAIRGEAVLGFVIYDYKAFSLISRLGASS